MLTPRKFIPSKIEPTKYCDQENLYVYGMRVLNQRTFACECHHWGLLFGMFLVFDVSLSISTDYVTEENLEFKLLAVHQISCNSELLWCNIFVNFVIWLSWISWFDFQSQKFSSWKMKESWNGGCGNTVCNASSWHSTYMWVQRVCMCTSISIGEPNPKCC